MYSHTTRGITVSVEPEFLEDQSEPEKGHYVWAYHIRIVNAGAETVRLLSRHWRITDSQGRLHEVRGAGVVGEQPRLTPGQTYEYTSGTPLGTPSGFMGGSYEMENGRGERFDVIIPTFSLDSPFAAGPVH